MFHFIASFIGWVGERGGDGTLGEGVSNLSAPPPPSLVFFQQNILVKIP